MNVLEVRNLSKSFGNLKAVDDVSFNVPEGSVFGLIGRNGAGKTTTIRMMMNIYLPDSGEVVLHGTKIGQEFRDKVGYLPEERGLYKKMKVLETLLFFAELKGKTGKKVEKRAHEYLKRFDLADRKNSKLEDLSKGNQQKIQFITTILHDPDFLIFDEPFSGLDPINTDLLKDIILELKSQGKVIIFSTHLMDFAERMCDHIAMIDHGKLIVSGALNGLKTKFAKNNVSLNYQGDLKFLNDIPDLELLETSDSSARIKVKDSQHSQELLKLLVENNIKVKNFNVDEISLHEIFVKLAGNEKAKGVEVKNV